jgi:hypothetical protein
MKQKSKKSERQVKLEKHHGTHRRKKMQKLFAVTGSVLLLSIPVYFLYFS